MKLSALIAFSALGMIVLFACAPPPPQHKLVFSPPANTVACASQFWNGVHYLQAENPPFIDPSKGPKNGFASSPPPDSTPIDRSSHIGQDLQNAFAIAPPFFKAELCNSSQFGITGIYVDPTICPSSQVPAMCGSWAWGYRSFSNGQILGRYIGIPEGLWQVGAAPTLDDFLTARLRAFLTAVQPNSERQRSPPSWISGLNYKASLSDPNDSSAMTVLAISAHEAAYALWYDAFVSPPGGLFKQDFCGGFYPAGSWSRNIAAPPNGWLGFAQANGTITFQRTAFPPTSLQDLKDFVKDPDVADALTGLSPNEDFAATFQLYALLNAKDANGNTLLTSLRLNFGDGTYYDIVQDLPNKGPLSMKMTCFKPSD